MPVYHRLQYYFTVARFLQGKARDFLYARITGTDSYATEIAKELEVIRRAAEALKIEIIDHDGGLYELRCGERTSFIKGTTTELESAVSHKIAGDKWMTIELLSRSHLPVPAGSCFTLEELPAALQYFRNRQHPVVVKPRRGTTGGVGVTAGITAEGDFRRAFYEASLHDRFVLVEEFITGENIRLLILEDQLLSAVRRVPAFVIGDGKQSIRRLIAQTNRRRAAAASFPRLWPIAINTDLKLTLRRQKLCLSSVPAAGARVFVKTLSNGHQGGVVEEVTAGVHRDYVEMSVAALRACRVRFGGVDFITRDITQPFREGDGAINEVNTTPSFYGHYQAANQAEVQDSAGKFLRYLFAVKEDGQPESRSGSAGNQP